MTSNGQTPTITLNGQSVPYQPGETLYQIAQRQGHDIPTLCYDDRLEAFGGCRLCVVDVEGFGRPIASCTFQATPGLVVTTHSAGVEKHRKTLLEMLVSENREVKVDPLRGYASQEMGDLVSMYDAAHGRFQGAHSGHTYTEDDNPFILRDYDLCISCYRCVRVCAEQEGDYAISIMNRGFETQITTEFNGLLRDSACTFCGQCVQTCPTGALADRKAIRYESIPLPIEKTRTICPYCGVGCSVDIMTKGEKIVGIQPAMDGPANEGALCIKGQYAYDFVQHSDRLATPLVRGADGALHPANWEAALDKAAEGFRKALAEHGRHSIYGVASGRTPIEANYTMQKFIRAGFGTHYIDNCSRA